jgi:hypothetical protein
MPENPSTAKEFESCWQKLDRARKHASDLAMEIREFWDSQPLDLELLEEGPVAIGYARVSRISPIPQVIPVIAGDAVHNIRSALDHFAWAAVDPSVRGSGTYFPVSSAATREPGKWRQQVERQLKGVSPELIGAVTALEPWEGGQEQGLWAVHQLDLADKHRLVLAAAVALRRIELHGDSYELTNFKRWSGWDPAASLPLEPIEWTPVEENAVLAIPLTASELGGTETTLRFDVVLAEAALLRRAAAASVLTALADSAEEVLRRLVRYAGRSEG